MKDFTFNIPTTVYFGEDQMQHLGPAVLAYGKRVLLVYGGGSIKASGLYDTVIKELHQSNIDIVELSGVDPNPRIETVRKGADICKKEGVEVLLSVGGGSALDAAKAIAAAACVDHDPWDFFAGKEEIKKALPILDIITLSATGSEMNPGAVISNPEIAEKRGLKSPHFWPKASFLNPSYTFTVSPFQTACGVADMMSHIIETYFDRGSGMFMLKRSMEALLKTIVHYGPIALHEPSNYEARANLMWASSWAINGFVRGAQEYPWSCHPMEHQLSAVYDIAHGLGLAILTPRWMSYCLDESNVQSFVEFAVNVFDVDPTLPPMEIGNEGIRRLSSFWYDTMELTSTLGALHIESDQFEAMATRAVGGATGIIDGFKPLGVKDIVHIYEMCR